MTHAEQQKMVVGRGAEVRFILCHGHDMHAHAWIYIYSLRESDDVYCNLTALNAQVGKNLKECDNIDGMPASLYINMPTVKWCMCGNCYIPQCFTVANNSSDVLTDLLQEPYGNVNNTFCQHYFCIGKYRWENTTKRFDDADI